MKYSLGENLANSKVKSHYELYIQLGNFKNIDIRYSGKYQLRIRAFIGPNQNTPKKYFKVDEKKCENTNKHDSQTTDSTESSYISSNLSFQELKRAKREITYYCNPISLEYEFQNENVNETICFSLNKPVNIQKNESKRKSILGSNSSIGRNSSKRFSLYSLYKSESKRSSSFYSYGSLPRSPLRTKEDESSSIESEKLDQSSISDQSLVSSPTSVLDQDNGYEKMNEKDLNVYLVFKLYQEKEENKKKIYKRIKNQIYFIGNLDQLINQCFFRRFATINFGYLYYGIWNMFISFCCTGYQSKPKDLLMAGLENLKYNNGSTSSIPAISYSSPSLFSKTKRNSLFTHNKRNSSIDSNNFNDKKKLSGRHELKRSFSEDNVNNSFSNEETIPVISENTIKILEKLLINSCVLFKNIFNGLLNAINIYYINLNQHPNSKPEEKYNVVIVKFYKILNNITQHIDIYFGNKYSQYSKSSYSENNLNKMDSDDILFFKPKDKFGLKSIIKNLGIDNNNNNTLNNDYLISVLNKSVSSYRNYLKKCESEQDLFSTTIRFINFINDQCNTLLSYYFSEYYIQNDEFINLTNEWLLKENTCYKPLLFISNKPDLGNKRINDFLNKWDRLNIVDIEDDNINNLKNEIRGYFNVYEKEKDPFFKLVKCDKNDNSIENNINSWPVIISSQVVNDASDNNTNENEIKDILTDKVDNEIKVTDIENDNTIDTYSNTSDDDDGIKYHLLIYVHGFLGNKYDLYTVRDYFERYINNSEKNKDKMKYVYLLSKNNQDDTYLDIESESQKLYEEIEEYMIKKHTKFTYISFICHSMGGLIARSLIGKTSFIKYWSLLHSFISISVPHIGMQLKNPFFSLCFKSYLKIRNRKKKTSLDQLALQDESDIKNCYIYKLSEKKSLELFKYVHLVSVTQDGYVPQYSSLIMPKKDDNSSPQKTIKEISQNIFNPVFKEKIYRNKYFNNYYDYDNGKTSSLYDSGSSSVDFLSCEHSASDLPSKYQSCLSLVNNSNPQSPNYSLSSSPINTLSPENDKFMNSNRINISDFSNNVTDEIIKNVITNLNKATKINNNKNSNNNSNDNDDDDDDDVDDNVDDDRNNNNNSNNNNNVINNININNSNNPDNNIIDNISNNSNDNLINNNNTISINKNDRKNSNNLRINTNINSNINTNNNSNSNININNLITTNNNNNINNNINNINNTNNTNNTNNNNNINNIDKNINTIDNNDNTDNTEHVDTDNLDYYNEKLNMHTFVSSLSDINLRSKSSTPSKPINHNLITPKTKVFRYNIHYRSHEIDLLGRTAHVQALREMFVIRMLFTLINHQVEKVNINDTF
ncbi:DUF676-domain-containing protein [Anaeromyces robustus]|uniref:DUF676-domain-containing protein n=1 Tax=Anaeromyces robustus TaxID=1754192 RepID=A0A1Y1X8L8_9FUNG|nr:DUF676-domain-containing protein [Anaeromyces robustus]|eukprot:ORX82072.1 DUF676-domain-containing protein [Anaeromyces robustus]